jgi:hypothetical protein
MTTVNLTGQIRGAGDGLMNGHFLLLMTEKRHRP